MELLYHRGVVKFNMKDFIGCRDDFDLAINMKQIGSQTDARAISYYMKGMCEKESGENLDAIESIMNGLKNGFSQSQGFNDLAAVYREIGDWRNALVNYNKAIKIDPNGISVIYRKASLYQNLGMNNEAIKEYQKCIKLNPSMDSCAFHLAYCYFAIGNYYEANKIFSRLISANPQHYSVYRREVMMYTAMKANFPLYSYNPNVELESFPRAFSTQLEVTYMLPPESQYISYNTRVTLNKNKVLFIPTSSFNKSMKSLLPKLSSLSNFVQLNSPGFIPNQRMHLVCCGPIH